MSLHTKSICLLIALGSMPLCTFGEPAADPESSPATAAVPGASPQLRFEPGSAKQNQEQLDRFTKHLAEHPQDVDALIARGFAYYSLRDFERGDVDVAQAIERAPKNPMAWRVRGRGLSIRDKFDEAIAAFDRAIEYGESDPTLFVERAMTYEASGDHPKAIVALGEVIERHPDDAEAYFCRAELLRVSDQWERAQADYQKAIELEPKKLVYRVIRANAFFEREESDRGFADVLEAMRLNPGDVGVDYQPTSDKELSEEALRHGEEQVRQMLKDRPAMAEHVSPGDKLWTWAVRKFAGEDLGSLIDWNPGSPAPFPARSSPPHGSHRGYILVAAPQPEDGKDASTAFDELWDCAVFELHNITSYREWEKIEQQLQQGQLTRDQYILAMLNSEELATHRTRAFYIKYAVPWFKSQKLPLGSPYIWECTSFHTAGDPRTELEAWGDDSRIPWYGDCYDIAIARREIERGNYEAARKVLDALLEKESALSLDCIDGVFYGLGCVEFAEQNFDAAIAALDRAIQAAPDQISTCASYCVKGDVEVSRWNFDRAIADYTAGMRLDPKSTDALLRRARAYSQRGELDAALKDVDAAIDLQPTDAALYVYRGNFWIDKQDFVRAEKDFVKAIELAPGSPDGYRGRANANYDLGNLDMAIENWDAAIKYSPNDYGLFVERGSVQQIKGRLKQAWEDYSAAIRIAPDQPEGYAFRAELLLSPDDKGYFRPDEAYADAKRSCEITDWKSSRELKLLAAACAAKKDFDNAVRWQSKALENAAPLERREILAELETYRNQSNSAKTGKE